MSKFMFSNSLVSEALIASVRDAANANINVQKVDSLDGANRVVDCVEAIGQLSDEEYEEFLDILSEDQYETLEGLMESATLSALYHGAGAKWNAAGNKIANSVGKAKNDMSRGFNAGLQKWAAHSAAKTKAMNAKAFGARHARGRKLGTSQTKAKDAYGKSLPGKLNRAIEAVKLLQSDPALLKQALAMIDAGKADGAKAAAPTTALAEGGNERGSLKLYKMAKLDDLGREYGSGSSARSERLQRWSKIYAKRATNPSGLFKKTRGQASAENIRREKDKIDNNPKYMKEAQLDEGKFRAAVKKFKRIADAEAADVDDKRRHLQKGIDLTPETGNVNISAGKYSRHAAAITGKDADNVRSRQSEYMTRLNGVAAKHKARSNWAGKRLKEESLQEGDRRDAVKLLNKANDAYDSGDSKTGKRLYGLARSKRSEYVSKAILPGGRGRRKKEVDGDVDRAESKYKQK